MVTPVVQDPEQAGPEEDELGRQATATFRRAAARVSYLSQDRPDISYAASVLSRGMAKLKQGEVTKRKGSYGT